MPRKKREIWLFEPWSDPAVGREHLVQIISAGSRDGKAWVKWKHLDGDQVGRTREEYLPLPLRPEGLTAEFCQACELAVDRERGIEASQAVGKIIRVIFGRSASGTVEPEAFAPVVEEQVNDSNT